MQQALEGIRILDFTRVLAGPLCTMMLADLGADVIKVENPDRGDDTRQWGPPWLGEGDARQSAYFLSVNRNKRSLTLNLKSTEGQAVAKQLAAKSHVLIENFKVGQMAVYGLNYETLREVNPVLVYASLTGYGQTGPYSSRPGYDYAIQAMSGLMSITGPAEGDPFRVGVAISDVIAGLSMASAIQAAVRHSERTGQGQYLDIALLETQIAALVNVASGFLVSGEAPQRTGNQHPNIVPYQTFEAADGAFVLAVGNDRQFRALCELVEKTEWASDERFASNPARVQNRDVLVPMLQAIFKTRATTTWIALLLEQGIPAGAINNIPTILSDPHIAARGLIQQTTLPTGETLPFVGSPLRLSETPPQLRYPPPALGEHTAVILREVLDMDQAAIQSYRDKGIT